MTKEPGNLSDFRRRALEEWGELIRGYFSEHRSDQLLSEPDSRMSELVPVALGGYPVSGTTPGSLRPEDRDPPRLENLLVQASHNHRCNRNRGRPDTDANNRIFRQGYEFLEPIAEGGFRLGLNFVSFQRNLKRLRDSLGLKDWLGDVNFGGPVSPKPGEPAPTRLIR